MLRRYYRTRVNEMTLKNTPKIPVGILSPKKKVEEPTEYDALIQAYEEQQANAFANVEDSQMLITLKGGDN